MLRLLWSLLLCVTVVLSARPAVAQETKKKELQVLAIGSPDAFENARALTGAIRRAVTRSKVWSLAPGEFSLEVLTAAFDCPDVPDAPCLTKIAAKVQAKVFIWGFVKKVGKGEVEADLHLWQDGENTKDTTVRFAANLNDDTDDTLLGIAEKAFFDLVGAPTGTLIIQAGTVDGEVQVNGMLAGVVKKGRARIEVTAGKLTVLVEAKGYQKLLGTVVVPPGGSATLELEPVPIREGVADEAEEDREAKASSDRAMGSRKTWGFVTLGAGGAALIVGSVFWAQSYSQAKDRTFEAYVDETPSDQDPCDRARDEGATNVVDICDSNVTARTMTYVMVPLGIVLGGVGTYLILSDHGGATEKSARSRGVQVRPMVGVGPNAGRFDLHVTF
jgi:hypothetical protein